MVEEVSNIAPQDLNIEILRPYMRERVKMVKRVARYVCRDELPSKYIQSAFNAFNFGFVYTDPDTEEIDGICIWKFNNDDNRGFDLERNKYIFILLICGRNRSAFGNRLFVDLDRFCIDHGIERIELSPANEKLKKYYESHGFELLPSVRTTIPPVMRKCSPTVLDRRRRGRNETRRSDARYRNVSIKNKCSLELKYRKNTAGTSIDSDAYTKL